MKNLSSFPDYFIINESRAQVIDSKGVSFNPYKDELIHPMEIIKKYAPWYDPTKEKTPLYRNVDRENYDEYLLLEAKKRKYVKSSSNSTRNYVNMIIDNEWKGYPDRSSSIIGSTHKWGSKTLYGRYVYRVIPLKVNSKIAISPTHDIWFAFDLRKMQDELGIETGTLMTKDLDILLSKNIKLKRFYNSKKELKADLVIDNRLKRIDKDFNILDKLKEIENRYGSIYDWMSHYISPENGSNVNDNNMKFEVVKYGNKTIIDGYKREFWTNAPCLLIKNDWVEKGDLNDVIQDYYRFGGKNF